VVARERMKPVNVMPDSGVSGVSTLEC
jgi:hypothetical protein